MSGDKIESLIDKLHSNQTFLSLEVSPSISSSIDDTIMEKLEHASEFDCIVCTDSPLARFRPSSILSSLKFQNALKKPVICTISMRDRNSIALCGDILAINEFGLRTFLTLTGDSLKNGDCIQSKGVFENSSLKLGCIIDGLNRGVAINGKALKNKVKKIYNFQVINSYSNNSDSIKSRIYKKLSNSEVQALFTQPVYSLEAAESLLSIVSRANQEYNTKSEIVLGFFPVFSYKTSLFLRDKLPGVYIPNNWIERLEVAHNKGGVEEYKVGLEISYNLFESLKILHNKFHFMVANKIDLVKEFITPLNKVSTF